MIGFSLALTHHTNAQSAPRIGFYLSGYSGYQNTSITLSCEDTENPDDRIDDMEIIKFYCAAKGNNKNLIGGKSIDCDPSKLKSKCEGKSECTLVYDVTWNAGGYYGGEDFEDCIKLCFDDLQNDMSGHELTVTLQGTYSCGWCGDGETNGNEQCDDGNNQNGDGCSSVCKHESCGDGIVNGSEECDTAGETARCDGDCTYVLCGDEHVNDAAGEECDDGNTNDGDGCSAACKEEFCGDGIVQDGMGEQCDDGDNNSDTEPDACRTNCLNDRCGDGVIDSDEDCDPAIPGTVCNRICDICQSDAECQGGLCGYCDTPCTRIACSCGPDGDCVRESVPDASCTGGECNPWPPPCGNMGADCGLPEQSCQWCVLDYWGPNGEGNWKCDPYPNAPILWPDQCGDPNPPPPPPSSPPNSSARSSDRSNSTSFSFSFSFSFSQGSSDNSESFSYSFSDHNSSTSFDTGTDGNDGTDDGINSSEATDDTGDDSGSSFSSASSISDATDDNGDADAGSSGESSSAVVMDSDDFGDVPQDNDDGTTNVQPTSSSSSYEQCDFCPACAACRRCGLGLMNICDAEECGGLGLCVFEAGLLGNSCNPDPSICGVCQ